MSPIRRHSFGALNVAGLCIFAAPAKQHNNPRSLADEIEPIPRPVVNAYLGYAFAHRLGIAEIPQLNLNQPGVNSFKGPFISKAVEPLAESVGLDDFYHGLLCDSVRGLARAWNAVTIPASPQRLGQHLRQMPRPATSAMLDLLAAGYAHYGHLPIRAFGVDLGEQRQGAYVH